MGIGAGTPGRRRGGVREAELDLDLHGDGARWGWLGFGVRGGEGDAVVLGGRNIRRWGEEGVGGPRSQR